ncbi:MAG: translation initiation factor IF-2 [Bacteroidetes bacterium GWA2_40_14]|jgi:translation initiation factor IF-2|nr:MAG: translation initiation factor IF-2 [Bacteroidetes bacterium GWA2_40_14]
MTDSSKVTRLSKIAREFNVGISTIVEFLHKKGITIDANPNTKITSDLYAMLLKEYSTDIRVKEESAKLELGIHRGKQESVSIDAEFKDSEDDQDNEPDEVLLKDLSSHKPIEKEHKPIHKPAPKEEPIEKIETVVDEVKVKVIGKIDLEPKKTKPVVHPSKIEKTKEAEPKKTESVHKHEPKKEKPVPVEEKPVVPEDKAETATASQKEEIGEIKTQVEQLEDVKVVGRIDLALLNQKTRPAKKSKEEKAKERRDREVVRKPSDETTEEAPSTSQHEDSNFIQRKVERLSGPTVIGKIELPTEPRKDKPGAPLSEEDRKKKKRKRIRKDKVEVAQEQTGAGQDPNKKLKQAVPQSQQQQQQKKGGKKRLIKKEVNEEDVQKQIKDTLARLTATKGKSKGSKHRRDKRELYSHKAQEEMAKMEAEKNILKVTEFVSVNELANMMDVAVTEVIGTCMNLGLFVSINQRLDAETMSLVADEFGYKVEFVSAELLESIAEEVEDSEEDLVPRPPIITVMGHVDHGKTSLLDYIRKANVIAGEAGGITQHIGAYSVATEDGKRITFLDTPGHEAFTAMRARGAQVTDVAIIIVAADDSIMPQTVEAINHAQAAGVPIVFAINKVDKPGANPEKIKEGLANMNLLVEEWGGKYQSQDISAKQGLNISELLDKVMLEAEMLDLKANPNKKALGTVIEASLDKGRGYVTTILVQSGTLKIGDILLAGNHTGHVKAMYNERNELVKEAGPSTPVQVLGLSGAAQAGDKFNVMESDREAKEIANRRQQLAREQGLRTQKHITLDEIGRRIAIGNFQELNVIVKGDVDGSIEALSDSLIKLSTEEIQVNVKHKAVGQISESDVLLAAASDAIIIGFQVRPSMAARKLAEKEEIDIRLYSVIYDAINEVRDAMEGMLSPEIKEEIIATIEVREVFKITKVGTIAGCYVRDGKVKRTSKVRVIRDGIVVYTGELGSLKRFKDDAKEVASGYECGLNIERFNDVKVGDIVEAYEQVEVKRTL